MGGCPDPSRDAECVRTKSEISFRKFIVSHSTFGMRRDEGVENSAFPSTIGFEMKGAIGQLLDHDSRGDGIPIFGSTPVYVQTATYVV